MKKCVMLEVANLKGSQLCLLEAGGLYLDNGNQILVDAGVAQRLKLQYKPFLVEVRAMEKESLSGGWYEVLRGKSPGYDEKASGQIKDDPPAPAPEPAPEPSFEPEAKEVEEPPADKSMGSKKAKKKTRSKKR